MLIFHQRSQLQRPYLTSGADWRAATDCFLLETLNRCCAAGYRRIVKETVGRELHINVSRVLERATLSDALFPIRKSMIFLWRKGHRSAKIDSSPLFPTFLHIDTCCTSKSLKRLRSFRGKRLGACHFRLEIGQQPGFERHDSMRRLFSCSVACMCADDVNASVCTGFSSVSLQRPLRFVSLAPVENRDPPRAVGRDRASSSREHAVSSFPFLSRVYRPDLVPTITSLSNGFQPLLFWQRLVSHRRFRFLHRFGDNQLANGDDHSRHCRCPLFRLATALPLDTVVDGWQATGVKVPFVTGFFVFPSPSFSHSLPFPISRSKSPGSSSCFYVMSPRSIASFPRISAINRPIERRFDPRRRVNEETPPADQA